jgi:hypothetical protein
MVPLHQFGSSILRGELAGYKSQYVEQTCYTVRPVAMGSWLMTNNGPPRSFDLVAYETVDVY